MSQSSLCPGHIQVESFGNDDEYVRDEDGNIEEEVEYVTLDLGSVQDDLLNSSQSYRLIGLDTPTPYLQLSGTFFRGEHHNLLGTELLFAEDKDEADPTKKHAMHMANTERRIRFREVELLDKNWPKEVKKSAAKEDRAESPDDQRGGGRGRSRGRGRGRGGKAKGKGPATDLEFVMEAGSSGTQDVSMDLT